MRSQPQQLLFHVKHSCLLSYWRGAVGKQAKKNSCTDSRLNEVVEDALCDPWRDIVPLLLHCQLS